jgi:hypothetical protein
LSKIALSGNASGTGTFTIASPNSNSDRILSLPDAAGTIQVSGNPISGTTGTFTGLVDISAAGAGQIQFPATQNASANANTLDDYEEGSFTPVAFGNSSAGTGTYIRQLGRYTKIGQVCCFQITIGWSAHTGTGGLRFSGLPFTALSGLDGQAVVAVGYNNGLSHTNALYIYVNSGNTTFTVTQATTAGVVSDVLMDTTVSELIFSGQYLVS